MKQSTFALNATNVNKLKICYLYIFAMRLVYSLHDRDDTCVVVNGRKFTVKNKKGFKYSNIAPLVLPDISTLRYVHDDTSWAQDVAPVSLFIDRMVGPEQKLPPNTKYACLTDDQSRYMKNLANQIVSGVSPDVAVKEYNLQMAHIVAVDAPTTAPKSTPTPTFIYVLLVILCILMAVVAGVLITTSKWPLPSQ
jgi:hypothetical protein